MPRIITIRLITAAFSIISSSGQKSYLLTFSFSPRKKLSIIYITSSPKEHMQIGVQNLTKAYWTSSGLHPDEKGIICLQSGILNWYSHQHRLWPYLIHWMFWLDCPKETNRAIPSNVDEAHAGRNHLGHFIFSSGVGRGSALLQLVCLSSVEGILCTGFSAFALTWHLYLHPLGDGTANKVHSDSALRVYTQTHI